MIFEMKNIIKGIKNPKLVMLFLLRSRIFHKIPDKTFIKIEYYLRTKKKLNLKNPKRYNEKLQYLKLYDRNPLYTKLVDKYEVRSYIENKIGEEYLIPMYGVYESYEDIDFDSLPNEFVLKPNHTSGDVYICKDKNEINHERLKKDIDSWMKKNYFWKHREWPYKNIKPKIICEKLMVDESGFELKDYKFFCYNGLVKNLFIATDRPNSTKFNFYDLNFNKLPFNQHYPNFNKEVSKPTGFQKMIELSGELSKEIPHVRVDFYSINGKIYFGELTFYHFSGCEVFEPDEWDYIFGEYLNVNNNH